MPHNLQTLEVWLALLGDENSLVELLPVFLFIFEILG